MSSSDFELEIECEFCHGYGKEGPTRYGDFIRCSNCDGAGYVPTELGKKVLELMRHNFKPMLEDAQED